MFSSNLLLGYVCFSWSTYIKKTVKALFLETTDTRHGTSSMKDSAQRWFHNLPSASLKLQLALVSAFHPKLLRRHCERCYGYLFLDALHTIYKLQLKSQHHIQTSQEPSWVKTSKNAFEIYLPLFSVQCWIWSLLIIPSNLSLVALDLHRRRKRSKTTTKAWEKKFGRKQLCSSLTLQMCWPPLHSGALYLLKTKWLGFV